MNPEINMKFMQIAMNYMPEAKEMLQQKGIEVDLEMAQPMLEILLKVMSEAYELGKEESK